MNMPKNIRNLIYIILMATVISIVFWSESWFVALLGGLLNYLLYDEIN